VDFVDIDPRTYNLSLEALDAKLQLASRANRVPKVVVPVHFAGQPLDTEYLRRLAERYGFSVIEDAAHAIGARYDGDPVGSCKHSDITVFSFHPVKIITTGEGGIATTNDDNLARKLRLLRSHGTTRDPNRLMNSDVGDWYYEQHDLGFNYRITDIQAALGISQLGRLNSFLEARRLRVERYRHDLRDLALILPYEDPRARSAWHLFVVQIDEKKTRKSRRQIFDNLRRRGIQVHVHYIPVHLQPYYRSLGFSENQFPVAEAYYRRALTLPLYATLSEEDQHYVVEELRNALQ
jgi:dTDP-4-amino-4,6-dideoxygalactose transaminase